MGWETKNTELIVNHQINYPLNKYQGPLFLGLSAIRWQMLFFFLLGITFVVYCIKKYIKREKINCSYLLFCTIPVLIVSSVFLYLNYPTRIFNYFAFFGLLVLSIPEKYLKVFFIGSFIFLIISGFFVMQDKRVFFENSDKEFEGAAWIAASLNGTVFCDQQFANLLIKAGYYNISGARDGDKLIYDLFYQNNQLEFLNALESLKEKNIQFIAITNRMQEKFILMLDIPQKPLNNYGLYENIEKIYDNGDVKIFKIK